MSLMCTVEQPMFVNSTGHLFGLTKANDLAGGKFYFLSYL